MSVNNSRQQLLNFPALLFMSAAIILALFQLFPRQPAFRDPANLSAKDQLSIAYMRVLVRSDPNNGPLRLSYVRVLTEAGFDDEAKEALQPLLDHTPAKLAFETGLALVRLDLQRLFRAPLPADVDRQIRDETVVAFHRLLPLSSSAQEQDELIKLAHDFGEPAVLADLYTRMGNDLRFAPPRRAQMFAQAAHYSLAAGKVLIAAQLASNAFHLRVDPKLKRDDALKALQAFLAANELKEGLTVAKESLKFYGEDAELLLIAADIAQASSKEELALQWLLLVREQRPTDLSLQERVLRLQLSQNHLSDAYENAKTMETNENLTFAQRELLAKTFDWNDDLPRSAVQWTLLALSEPNDEREKRAFDIALALNHDEDVVALVESAMQRRSLRAEESTAYVNSGLHRYEPTRLQQKLSDYLNRNRRDRTSWQNYSRLNDVSGALDGAVVAMQKAQELSALTPEDKISLAQNYWRNQQADAALNLLLSISKPPAELSLRYWRLLADLAWYLERDSLAKGAYQQILAKYAADDATAIARLYALAERSGNRKEIERMADYGWKLRHDKIYFVRLLELAHEDHNDVRLASLLSEADKQTLLMNDVPEYWQYKAETLQQSDNRFAAEGALRRLYQLSLHDAEVVDAYGWLLLAKETQDRPAIFGVTDREQFLAAENVNVNELMAAMQLTLGQAGKAESLFAESIARRHHDFFWVMVIADNLEWLGCAQSANQTRLLALGNLVATMNAVPALNAPGRLADKFNGRLDAKLPDDEDDYSDWQRVAAKWELPSEQLDNARQFALRWLSARMMTDEWQDFAEDFIDHDVEAVRETVWRVAEQLQHYPLEPGAELPLSLNEVASGSRRRADPKLNILQRPDLAACVSAVVTLQQYSDRLPVPKSIAEKKQ